MTGTPTLNELAGATGDMRFQLAHLQPLRCERLAWPLTRAYVKRENA